MGGGYHILPWYSKTEAICLGVMVAWDRAFETWLQHVLVVTRSMHIFSPFQVNSRESR